MGHIYLHKTQLPLRHMHPYNNLGPSLFSTYDTPTPLDDVQRDDDQARRMNHHHREAFTQPPGAVMTGLPTTARLRQAEFSLRSSLSFGRSKIEEHTGRLPTPFSIDSQSEGSEASFNAPSPPNSIPPMPYPTHVHHSGTFVSGYRPSYVSPSMPGAERNLSSRHSFTHSRGLSQPSQSSLMSPPSVMLGGGNPVDAGAYAGVPQPRLTSAVSKPASGTVPPTSLPVPSNAYPFAPQIPLHELPTPTHPSFSRRFSEADALRAYNVLTLHSPEIQPPPAAYPPSPGHAGSLSTDMTMEPSSQIHGDRLTFLNSEEPFQCASSSGLQDGRDGATPFRGPASPGAHSQSRIASRTLSEHVSLTSPRKQRRKGKRKRVDDPKDPRAAQRLRGQRKIDDEHIETLYGLFVPRDIDIELVPKKDRLGLIVQYAKTTSVPAAQESVEQSGSTTRRRVVDPFIHVTPTAGHPH